MLADSAARSPDEAAMLKAVLADLTDDHPKLVYADWLDDRGDPRAGELRAAVENARGDKPKATKPAPWLALTGVPLRAGFRRGGLADHADALLRLARPVLTLTAKKANDAKLAVGASKFNGEPDLPDGEPWPEGDAGPLAFYAQINLSDLAGSPAAADLPAGGWLSVFYDDEAFETADAGWRLLQFPAAATLARRSAPDGVKSPGSCCWVGFREGLSLPASYESPFEKAMGYDQWSDAQSDSYDGLSRGLHGGHHLLGYPQPIQGDTLGSKARRHLLTLDSDNAPGWCFGDMGALYFSVTAGELAKGKLGKPRFEMQCG